MNNDSNQTALPSDFEELADTLENLIGLCSRLRQENTELRHRCQELQQENNQLSEARDLSCERLRMTIDNLKTREIQS